jgi:hypothetical protein
MSPARPLKLNPAPEWGFFIGEKGPCVVSVDPFKWKRHGAEWRLYRDRRVVGRVVPDAEWPGMWRVQLPGGLSEMVNLARARDAALDWSATPRCHKVLQQNQGRFSAPTSPIRLNRRSLPSAPGAAHDRR